MATPKRRIGIVGFGRLGKFLFEEVKCHPDIEVAFVWNRTLDTVKGSVPDEYLLYDLEDCHLRNPDLIVEVAHPDIVAKYGKLFVTTADFMIGSPTSLANAAVLHSLTETSRQSTHGVYIPTGAFWGAQDIRRMADRGSLKGLKVTMKKHPSAFKLTGYLVQKLLEVTTCTTLYEGPVRELCALAPNNVNTMACAAIAAHNLGFDGVTGCLVADPSLSSHVVEIEVTGPGAGDNFFHVRTVRTNPAASGVVTGKQTYGSFLSSLLDAYGKGSGIHIC